MSTRQDTILCRKIMEKKIFLFLSERCKCNLGVLIKYFWPPLFSPIVYLLFDISTCGARAGETHNRAALGAAISWYQGPDIDMMTLSHSGSPSHLTPLLMHFWDASVSHHLALFALLATSLMAMNGWCQHGNIVIAGLTPGYQDAGPVAPVTSECRSQEDMWWRDTRASMGIM